MPLTDFQNTCPGFMLHKSAFFTEHQFLLNEVIACLSIACNDIKMHKNKTVM